MINLNLVKFCSTQTYKGLPVITVPKYIEANLKNYKKAQEKRLIEKQKKLALRGTQNLLISSKHKPQFNHYLNQSYSKHQKLILASDGWRKGKHKNDVIIFHPFMNKPHFNDVNALPADFNFTSLGLCSTITESISSLNIYKPTNIQIKAIPSILSRKSVLCSAETGSGKTLAYLAPLMDIIYRYKQTHNNFFERSPLAIILLPSRELVEQVGLIARQIGSYCGIGVAVMMGGPPKNITHTGYDVIVSSIGMISKHIKTGVYSISKLQHLVLDETDTLLDDSFSFSIWDIFDLIKFKSDERKFGTQLILVSATIPRGLDEILGDIIDLKSMDKITSSKLHYLMPHVKHVFYRLHKFDRDIHLLTLAKKNLDQNLRTLIFSNKTPMSNWVYHYLNQNGIPCARLNKSLTDEDRLFDYKKFQSQEVNFLSCTDLASKGLDPFNVSCVINFDCPHYVSDYIHRAGRTGRVGNSENCSVHSFVSFKPDVKMLNELEYSVRTNKPIHNVNANIKRLLLKQTQQKMKKYIN